MSLLSWAKNRWPKNTSVLRVQDARTFCEYCANDADDKESHHFTIPSALEGEAGCGRRFSQIYVDFALTDEVIGRLRRQHPGIPLMLMRRFKDPDSSTGYSWREL
jgi:hypothetical protein